MIKLCERPETRVNEQTWPWLGREDLGRVTVIRLRLGRFLDDDAMAACFQPLFHLAYCPDQRDVVVNLEATSTLSPRALGFLVDLSRRLRSTGRQLALCGMSPWVQDRLEVAGLGSVFLTYATEEEALQALGAVVSAPPRETDLARSFLGLAKIASH